MRRACFPLHVKPRHIDAFREAHAAVWGDTLAFVHGTARRNYSILLRPDYLQANLDGTAAAPVNALWQQAMAEHFVDLDVPAEQAFLCVDEVFKLDDQLTSLCIGSVNQKGKIS